ncbi:MAG: 5'-nucleotidase C-terminal domain-containing protein [Bacteroidia bacterium]
MLKLLKYLVVIAAFTGCARHYSVSSIHREHYDLKNLKGDSLTAVQIAPYKSRLDTEMLRVIAVSDEALTKEGYMPGLANFVLMAVEQYVSASKPELQKNHVAFINRGGLRASLPKGNVTVGNIYELMPFDNSMVVLKIKGTKLKECIEASARNGKLLGWNLSYIVKNEKPEQVLVLGQPVDENAEYTIVTTDYLANGGDDSGFFLQPLSYEAENIKLRDVIISYCTYFTKNNKHITAYSDERIRVSK